MEKITSKERERIKAAFREGAEWGYIYGSLYQSKRGSLRSLKASNNYMKSRYGKD